MDEMILLKQGEIVLKGLNRKSFEKKLMANISRQIKPLGDFTIYAMQSTIYIEPIGQCDMDAVMDAAKSAFGIVSVSRAVACEKDKDAILALAKEYLAEDLINARSFKVETKRADKSFPMTSIELSQYVGGGLHDAFPHLVVDVHAPQLAVTVEVRDLKAYVHASAHPGAGGLPVGTGGRAVSLLSGGIDSPVATYMIAKRGVSVIPVHFFSFPYTSEQSKQKVLDLAKILTKYCLSLTVEIVPFTKIQEEIRKRCPEDLFTIIMRRFMMRIAEKIALNNNCAAIVTGESLGQVASQTMEAMAVTQECASLPVLRPLVGMDKREIVDIAQKIGTFETSILPYEDCCTIFTPKHPRTKPKLDMVLEAEGKLSAGALIDEAIANIERVRV